MLQGGEQSDSPEAEDGCRSPCIETQAWVQFRRRPAPSRALWQMPLFLANLQVAWTRVPIWRSTGGKVRLGERQGLRNSRRGTISTTARREYTYIDAKLYLVTTCYIISFC